MDLEIFMCSPNIALILCINEHENLNEENYAPE